MAIAISDTQKVALDKMCMTAKNVTLGTVIQTLGTNVDNLGEIVDSLDTIAAGTHIVSSSEGTAETCTIDTGKTITGFIVQIYRSGKLTTNYAVSASTTNLTIATNSTDYVLTSGDVINYIIF